MSVFTSINNRQLEAFLANYSLGSLQSFTGIAAGITNSNFFVDTDSGRYILTIVEHESPSDVEWFMQLLEHLRESKIPCAKPFKAQSGDFTGQYTGVIADKPATLVECLNGADKNHVNEDNCNAIGRVLASMHTSCQNYESKRSDSRGAGWRTATAQQVREKLVPQEQQLLDQLMQAGFTELLNSLPSSVIHADLFRDNVLFENDAISGIIDFYYACSGCMLYDLAITFNDWCRLENTEIDYAKARALLAGYESIRPLETNERFAWPEVIRCAALRFWLSRLQDLHFPPEALTTHTKDPSPFEKILVSSSIHYEDMST